MDDNAIDSTPALPVPPNEQMSGEADIAPLRINRTPPGFKQKSHILKLTLTIRSSTLTASFLTYSLIFVY